MTDKITLLKTKAGIALTKTFDGDTVEAYGRAKYFQVQTMDVDGIKTLSELLTTLEDKSDICVIRGELNKEKAETVEDAKDPKSNKHYARIKQIFDDVPKHFIMVDIDNWDTGDLSPLTDPVACVEAYIEKVLPEFGGYSHHWQMSASSGQPGNEHKLKCHIWFWLGTAYDSTQLTAWAKSVSPLIDVAPLRTVQVHYTANPIYKSGKDPVKKRSGLESGFMGDVVPLVIDETILLRATQYQGADRDYEFKDPSEKKGVIGAFHRAYAVEEVINELLSDEFEFEMGSDRRATWLNGGGTPGGCFVTDDRQHFGNTHNTDPFDNRVVNLFDLCRHYLHKHLDNGHDAFEIMDMRDKPSFQAMVAWCEGDERVQGELEAAKEDDRAAKAHRVQQYKAIIATATDNYELEEDICRRIANDRALIDSERIILEGAVRDRARELTGERIPIATVRSWIAPAPAAGGFQDLSEAGTPLATVENFQTLMDRETITIRYNVMTKEDEILIPGYSFSRDNQACASLNEVLSRCNRAFLPARDLKGMVTQLGDQNMFNPMMTWINSEPWDGVDRLDKIYNTLTVAPEINELRNMLMRKWFLSGVCAAASPDGVTAQGVLVLAGPQGVGKTRWFSSLVGDNPDMFTEGVTLDPRDKDSQKLALSSWITELGELDATFRKSDIAALKAFITKKKDKFRKPYAAAESEMDRRTIFGGTVNDTAFLKDNTGTRRFYTLEVEGVDHNHGINMQQVWAQVYEEMYLAGESHWLENGWLKHLSTHNEIHTEIDPVEEMTLTRLDWDQPQDEWVWSTSTEIAELIGLSADRRTTTDIGRTLKNKNCEKKRTGGVSRNLVPSRRAVGGSDAFL